MMSPNSWILGRFMLLCALLAACCSVRAQDSTLAEIKYKEDYDRLQSIIRASDPAKRANQMLAFYKERPDTDARLLTYADNVFDKDLETLMNQENTSVLRDLCARALKLRPKFGEVYLFQGVVLKSEHKIDEAMLCFAKCYMIKNPLQSKAKQQLDIAYRAGNQGSLIGEDKILKRAVQELEK